MKDVKRFHDLWVYQSQSAFGAAMKLFDASKAWPAEERYALTDQVRRASRAVCANVAQAWRKRRYPRHFISKPSDADAEAAEVQSWLRFAHACGYLNEADYDGLKADYHRIITGLVRMMTDPDKWCGPSNLMHEPEAPYLPT
jgi:four helix bundle protein